MYLVDDDSLVQTMMLAREAQIPESEKLDSPLRIGIQAGITILDNSTAIIGIESKNSSSSIGFSLKDDENEEHQASLMIGENGDMTTLFAPASETDIIEYFRPS